MFDNHVPVQESRREIKENHQILKSSSEFTRCEGIRRSPASLSRCQLCADGPWFSVQHQNSTTSSPSSARALGHSGVLQEIGTCLLQRAIRAETCGTEATELASRGTSAGAGATLGWMPPGDRGVRALCSIPVPSPHAPLPAAFVIYPNR